MLTAFMIGFLLACIAFSVDVGYMVLARTEAQTCADSAALAAAWEMFGEERILENYALVYSRTRDKAVEYAALNHVATIDNPLLLPNYYNNDMSGDVLIGRLENPQDQSEELSFFDPTRYNAVTVHVRFDATHNQRLPLFFAKVMGFDDFEVDAEATAAFADNVRGFSVDEGGPKSSLLPFTVEEDDWLATLNGEMGSDNWTYDPETGDLTPGGDGIPELKMYPVNTHESGDSAGAGNWGTIDIGGGDNSTSDLERQIREGPSAEDLAPYDGTIELDALTGTLDLNGDTGISVGIADALDDIVGQPRTIPIYRSLTDGGNNANYEIVGFSGIRIVDYRLTGNDKFILIQPAYVFDPTAVTGGGAGSSYFVGQPVHLVR